MNTVGEVVGREVEKRLRVVLNDACKAWDTTRLGRVERYPAGNATSAPILPIVWMARLTTTIIVYSKLTPKRFWRRCFSFFTVCVVTDLHHYVGGSKGVIVSKRKTIELEK